MGRIVERREAADLARSLRGEERRIVFTNGCFDLVHAGHVLYLKDARSLGDVLIVGVNSDASVRRLKGKGRPLTPEGDRIEVLASIGSVDFVVLFGEDTPARLIEEIRPDVLVKGGDYTEEEVVGSRTVASYGGKTVIIPLLPGRSTQEVIRRIVDRYGTPSR